MSCPHAVPLAAAALLCAGAAFATTTDNLSLSIDTTQNGAAIPADFVGLSVSRDNISGDHGYTRIFNSGNANFNQLEALFRQVGIRHIRTVSGAAESSDPDPSAGEDDDFFHFASDVGIVDKDIIYSLHLCNADDGDPTTDDQTAAQHIWSNYSTQLQSFALDNECDFPGNLTKDPELSTYSDYKTEWQDIRNWVLQVAAGAPFSGPDTGSNWPVPGAQNTSVSGVPWTLQFVRDEDANINMGSQHYYCVNDTVAPTWTSGMYIGQYDVVADPKDPNNPGAYYISNSAGASNTHPSAVPSRWTLTTAAGAIAQEYPNGIPQGKGIWVSGDTYAVGDEVQDPKDSYNAYICLIAGQSNNHPAVETGGSSPRWASDKVRNSPGPAELTASALSSSQDSNFATLNSAALMGNHTSTGWPAPATGYPATLPYRLTEASPFSGGQNPAAHVFASALLGLDMFNWFAAHYCSGLDPFTRLAQYNAPLYFDGTNDTAAPYAYAMLAFNLAGPGNIERPIASFTLPAGLNLTAYAMGNSTNTDLYVVIINKTYNAAGAVNANVTLNTAGFTAASATSMLLTSGSPGDASAETATLGGATIPNDGSSFAGTWQNETVSSGVCTVLVEAATAKIIHLHQ